MKFYYSIKGDRIESNNENEYIYNKGNGSNGCMDAGRFKERKRQQVFVRKSASDDRNRGEKEKGGGADKNSIVPLKERLSLFPFNPPLLPATKRSSPLVACCRKPLLATPPPANKGRARVTFLFPHDLTSVDLHRFAIHHLLLSLVVPVPLLVTPAFLPLPRGNNIVSCPDPFFDLPFDLTG